MTILKKAPAGANVLDLDAQRQARQEARTAAGEAAPFLKLSAGYVELKPEVDVLSGEDFAGGRVREGLAKILADPADVGVLADAGFTSGDLEAVIKFVAGGTLGE